MGIKEGWLLKQSAHLKEWRRRWCVLTPKHLCSFKSEGEYKNQTEVINLRDCTFVRSADEDLGKENSFKVVAPNRIFYLVSDSPRDTEAWIGHIGRQMARPA